MKILVYSQNFDSKNGGVVVLHRLVHLINTTTEHEAFLVPNSLNLAVSKYSIAGMKLKLKHNKKVKQYTNKSQWSTPVLESLQEIDLSQVIVVYPEITSGNPLNAKNVVRWLLHQPTHFSGQAKYGKNELIFKFNSAIKDFSLPNSKTSEQELKVIYYPTDLYNEEGVQPYQERTLTCHAIRKGKHKPKVHSEESILIDSLSHEEVAHLFKQAKRFISYDDYTAYSIFANLCGCESIVVPDSNTTIEQWYPNITDRYGIAYGFDEGQLRWAKDTQSLVKEHVENEHRRSEQCVKDFIKEALDYFQL
ncbi:WavQ [Vibrio anguillarum]|uniref:WavQ n=1 Tax=Vibrio anguillarum TaxID=55601 RepID=UPI0016948B21|nr:WavQ [Vibrio anguillarum]MCC4236779.1 WavQ [Vibrio anguillarum]MDT3848133.1 WavQ [Vibrio anguillarum]NOI04639.1 WavQ [Vibrio anguillarum]